MLRTLFFACVALTAASCGGGFGFGVSHKASGAAPQLRSVPQLFHGTITQLFVADAAASCAYIDGSNVVDDSVNGWSDDYLAHVRDLMAGTLCPYEPMPPNTSMVQRYILQRSQLSCDNPTQLAPGMQANGAPAIEPTAIPWPSGLAMSDTGAGEAIRSAPFNLCIAQKLREMSPGAASGEALLLSGADQRELLEVIRERTQIAMLQYAALAVAFAPHTSSSGASVDPEAQALRSWAQANPAWLSRMGADFATAVQLDVDVTKETARLFGRSASARLARGGTAIGPDDAWGAGSWQQRTLAVLYGGDPLAQAADGSSPWRHPWAKTVPGEALPQVRSGVQLQPLAGPSNWDWPTRYEEPYVADSIKEPQVAELLRMAQRFDLLSLKIAPLAKKFFHCTQHVDRAASADYLYRAVEAALRTQDCDKYTTASDGTVTCQPVSVADVGPSSNFGSFVLYTQYGLTPTHATELITTVDEQIANLCPYPAQTPAPPYSGAFPSGALDLQGTITAASAIDGNPGTWWHVSRDARFVSKTLAELEGLYSRYARYRVPFIIDDTAPLYEQGLLSVGRGDDGKRLLGAVGALVATRELIENANDAGNGDGSVAAYLSTRTAIQAAIDAAVGGTSVGFVAKTYGYRNPGTGEEELAQPTANVATGALTYQIIVDVPQDDGWWDPTQPTQFSLFAVPNNPTAAASMRLHGSYGAAPSPTLNAVSARLVSAKTGTGLDVNRTRWLFEIDLPTRDTWTFVAAHGSDQRLLSVVSLAKFTQPLIGVSGDANRPIDGQYHAFDGTLNTTGLRAVSLDPSDPSQPAYDGFGMPVHYVPPIDPSLVGGNPGDNIVTAELRKAQNDASTAITQLNTAVQDFLTIQKDDQSRKANALEARTKMQLEIQGLCGNNIATCDLHMVDFQVDETAEWPGAPPSCPSNWNQIGSDGYPPAGVDITTYMNCFAYTLMRNISVKTKLAHAVIAHKDDPSAPSFIEYDGGSLRQIMIDQWAALRAMRDVARSLIAANLAAGGKLTVASSQVQYNSERVNDECGPGAWIGAQQAGSSMSFLPSWSPGPIVAQIDKCNDVTEQTTVNEAQVYSAVMDAFATLSSELTQFTQAAKELQDESARGTETIMQARLAVARDRLEQQIADLSPNLQTSFGLYRSYTSLDIWRAKALLDAARMSALLARRSVEAHFVVDLSTMAQDEPQVVAPQTWADEVYGYELDIPAAIGLTVGTQAPGTIYPYALADYVTNLQSFVSGFAVARPIATNGADTNLIDLPGPIPPATTGPTPFGTYSWTFFCPSASGGSWLPLPQSHNLADTCGTGVAPNRARVDFSLDPWGRVNEDISHMPLTHNFNVRWAAVAVNLVGTAVHDCSSNPTTGCTQNPFVSYNLQHFGPAWITDYNEEWWSLDVTNGFIEDAKAVAAELLVDVSYWSNPYVVSATRNELLDRPLGGTYELELNTENDPAVNLANLTDVQLLYKDTFWSRQQ